MERASLFRDAPLCLKVVENGLELLRVLRQDLTTLDDLLSHLTCPVYRKLVLVRNNVLFKQLNEVVRWRPKLFARSLAWANEMRRDSAKRRWLGRGLTSKMTLDTRTSISTKPSNSAKTTE